VSTTNSLLLTTRPPSLLCRTTERTATLQGLFRLRQSPRLRPSHVLAGPGETHLAAGHKTDRVPAVRHGHPLSQSVLQRAGGRARDNFVFAGNGRRRPGAPSGGENGSHELALQRRPFRFYHVRLLSQATERKLICNVIFYRELYFK
jgi:hypothetical protein